MILNVHIYLTHEILSINVNSTTVQMECLGKIMISCVSFGNSCIDKKWLMATIGKTFKECGACA